MTAITLTAYDAIDHAEEFGLTLSKHTDPVEEAREGLTVDEARAVADEDPGLIYIVVEPVNDTPYEAGQKAFAAGAGSDENPCTTQTAWDEWNKGWWDNYGVAAERNTKPATTQPRPEWTAKTPAGTGAALGIWGEWTVEQTDEGASSCSPEGASASEHPKLHTQARAYTDSVSIDVHHPTAGIISVRVPWDVLGALAAAMSKGDRAEVLAQMNDAPVP